jgi:DNA repair exonuclease SbcCD ATPase subunit
MNRKLTFERIEMRNFWSTGPAVTVNFAVAPTTLIVGHNGAGKSSVIDAIIFALYGSAYRTDVNKADLVNHLIQEKMTVELWFKINSVPHRIKRGIKPNVFEHEIDGVVQENSTHARRTQELFEQNHLGVSKKLLQQIVVIGKAGYTPFMSLTAAERRAVVENILDIAVFSRMAVALQERIQVNKINVDNAEAEVRAVKSKLSLIDELERTALAEYKKDLEECKQQVLDAITERKSIKKPTKPDVSALKQHKTVSRSLSEKIGELKAIIRTCLRDLDGLDLSETCRLCGQAIDASHRKKEATSLNSKIGETEKLLHKVKKEYAEVLELIEDLEEKQESYVSELNDIALLDKKVERYHQRFVELKEQGEPEIPQRAPIEEELTETKGVLKEHTDQRDILLAARRLLKDDGIRSSVVRQYLPILNTEITRYLTEFQLPARFIFDETLSERIHYQHVHDKKFGNFSEGEKMRMELALLFVWRSIAREKASLDTNLLFMDETFDSSLDDEGCSVLLKTLRGFENQNTIVISHNRTEEFQRRFDRVLEFTKVGNFTSIEELQ